MGAGVGATVGAALTTAMVTDTVVMDTSMVAMVDTETKPVVMVVAMDMVVKAVAMDTVATATKSSMDVDILVEKRDNHFTGLLKD